MSVTGTPTNLTEFIGDYYQRRSKDVRGIMGEELKETPKNISILDVGCGIGNALFALHANGFSNMFGLDIERQLVEHAKKDIPDANLVVADAEHIPFSKETFDCAVCYDLLEHVLKPEKVLGEISGVLKKGGILYITAANGYSVNDIVFRWGGRILRGRSSHVQKFRKRHIVNLLENNGFQILKIHEIKECTLIDLPIVAKIPLHSYLRRIAHKVDKFMSYGWEFKVAKRGCEVNYNHVSLP